MMKDKKTVTGLITFEFVTHFHISRRKHVPDDNESRVIFYGNNMSQKGPL